MHLASEIVSSCQAHGLGSTDGTILGCWVVSRQLLPLHPPAAGRSASDIAARRGGGILRQSLEPKRLRIYIYVDIYIYIYAPGVTLEVLDLIVLVFGLYLQVCDRLGLRFDGCG